MAAPLSFEPDPEPLQPLQAPKSFVADAPVIAAPKSFVADAPVAPAKTATSGEDDDEHLYDPGNNLPPTRYGRDASGRLTSTWDGSKWVGLFDGKKVGAPAAEESDAPTLAGKLGGTLSSFPAANAQPLVTPAVSAATHWAPPTSRVYPILPPEKAKLVPSGVPQSTSPEILSEEPAAVPPAPLGPIMVGPAKTIPTPQKLAEPLPDKNNPAQALLDLRTLLLGPAYGTALKSDSGAESLINGFLRATSSFSTPEGIATMAVGAGLISKLPQLLASAKFTAALADHPLLAKGLDLAAKNAVPAAISATSIPSGVNNIQQGIRSGNLEQVGQGIASVAIGGVAGWHVLQAGVAPTIDDIIQAHNADADRLLRLERSTGQQSQLAATIAGQFQGEAYPIMANGTEMTLAYEGTGRTEAGRPIPSWKVTDGSGKVVFEGHSKDLDVWKQQNNVTVKPSGGTPEANDADLAQQYSQAVADRAEAQSYVD